MSQWPLFLHQCSQRRYVRCCQNGVIQLAWDEIKIHLRPANFARLVRLLEKGIVELDLTETHEGRCCCLKQIKLGYFQLRLGHIGLELTLMEFLALTQMARLAAHRLSRTNLLVS